MENKELYPELADYIFDCFGNYFTEKEKMAYRHLNTISKFERAETATDKHLIKIGWVSSDPKVLELTKDGFEAYKRKVTERIFNVYKNELVLNLCPKCNKIARTPEAKQCRFCFHTWREKPNKEYKSTSE